MFSLDAYLVTVTLTQHILCTYQHIIQHILTCLKHKRDVPSLSSELDRQINSLRGALKWTTVSWTPARCLREPAANSCGLCEAGWNHHISKLGAAKSVEEMLLFFAWVTTLLLVARYGFVFKIGDLASSSWPFQWRKWSLSFWGTLEFSQVSRRNEGSPLNSKHWNMLSGKLRCLMVVWLCLRLIRACKDDKKIDHVLGGALRAWYRWFPSVCTCVTAL